MSTRRAGAPSLIRTSVLILVTLAVAGCVESALATESPLSNARPTPEALAQAALDGLATQSDSALAALMIKRDEYENLLWPEMPDQAYTPFDFVWGMTGASSRKARRNMLEEYQNVPLRLVRVDLGPDSQRERYPSFTLYREARMTVRRTDTGVEEILPLMDGLVEMSGGWKFMNFRDDS